MKQIQLFFETKPASNWMYMMSGFKKYTIHDLHSDGMHYNTMESHRESDSRLFLFLTRNRIPFQFKVNGDFPKLVIPREYFILPPLIR